MRSVFAAPSSQGYVANLANGLPSWLKFQRASASTVWTPASAAFTTLGNDVPAIDFDPVTGNPLGIAIYGQVTNQIRNSTVQGAANGTPGTNPTYWTVNGAGNGLTKSNTLTTVNGIPGIAIRIWGTATATSSFFIAPEAWNSVVAANGQTWTQSAYLAITAGSLGATTFAISPLAYDSGGAGLLVFGASAVTPTATLARFVSSGAISGAPTTAYAQPRFRVDYANGTTFDVTIFIGWPQFELSPTATPYIQTSGSVATRSADQLTVDPAAFAGVFGAATSGMGFLDVMIPVLSAIADALYVGDGSANNTFMLAANNGTGLACGYGLVSASIYNTGSAGAVSSATWYRVGLIWAPFLGGYYVCLNGAAPVGCVNSMPPITQGMLGNRPYDLARPVSGYIKQVALYPFAAPLATFRNLCAYGAQLP